jgi:hypothetical protein
MSDGMEDRLMDDEIRSALEMTKEELLARAAKGEPARVARSDPRSSDFVALERAGIVRVTSDVDSITVEDVHLQEGHFEDRRPVEVKRPSVTIR